MSTAAILAISVASISLLASLAVLLMLRLRRAAPVVVQAMCLVAVVVSLLLAPLAVDWAVGYLNRLSGAARWIDPGPGVLWLPSVLALIVATVTRSRSARMSPN